ncbi:MAG TPA: hypothetical protein VFQ61_03740 [Polyangiaceae bacterium]|nr:hypothetical protein [Polyangiaceae bacterium]
MNLRSCSPARDHDTLLFVMVDEDVALVRRVLGGEAEAHAEFVRRLSHVVRHRVARVLMGAGAKPGSTRSRQALLDLMQEVYVVLLDRKGRVLSTWDPARGLSLENFVGLVAEREAIAFQRSGRRSAWAEQPTDDLVDHTLLRTSPEDEAAAKEQLELLLEHLSERLSPQGLLLFEALFVSETPVPEICTLFATTPTAVYNFRARLKQVVSDWKRRSERTHGASTRNVVDGGRVLRSEP